jgi:voltage-dependent potassium channel beta subunit
VYGDPRGSAETIMGRAIQELRREKPADWKRADIIITTKIFWGGDGVNEKGLSRKHIMEGLDDSLKRLQVDFVDLVFCHRPDPHTPTETVVRAMTDAIRSGRATAWGTSEWSAQQITEAVWIAQTHGLEPPQFEQPQYSLVHRERFEKEYHPLYRHPYNMGTTIWSPLASGILTGKYNDTIPAGSRMTEKTYGWLKAMLDKMHVDGTIDKIRELTAFAKSRFGCSVGQLALAWCVKNQNVSTVLLGATKPEQLKENLGAITVAEQLTDEDMAKMDEIMKTKPAAYGGYGGEGMRALLALPSDKKN